MTNLWSENHPAKFWMTDDRFSREDWDEAVQRALPILDLSHPPGSTDAMLESVLGEGQFGSGRWKLRDTYSLYYHLKPLIPRWVITTLRQTVRRSQRITYPLMFPIEDRYVRFLQEVLRLVMEKHGLYEVRCRAFWPHKKRFGFVLRHDIEKNAGQQFVRKVADLEESYGFRSVFNFVAERYPLDYQLIGELKERGFEIGIHGLHHDGKDFASEEEFMRRSVKVNQYLRQLDSVTYCAPLTHRNGDWLQHLDIEYDQSFFDTDPYEPMSGGTMSIFPFIMGKVVEMPYTLLQDFSLYRVLNHRTPQMWLDKLAFIRENHGMALLNTHPDYLLDDGLMSCYDEFLSAVSAMDDHWHALPRDAARWWRRRHAQSFSSADGNDLFMVIRRTEDGIVWRDVSTIEDTSPAGVEAAPGAQPVQQANGIAASHGSD